MDHHNWIHSGSHPEVFMDELFREMNKQPGKWIQVPDNYGEAMRLEAEEA